jgi:hypothetical protein
MSHHPFVVSNRVTSKYLNRAGICKRLRSSGIDSSESIPTAYVAWKAGTSNVVVVSDHQAENRLLGPLKGQ